MATERYEIDNGEKKSKIHIHVSTTRVVLRNVRAIQKHIPLQPFAAMLSHQISRGQSTNPFNSQSVGLDIRRKSSNIYWFIYWRFLAQKNHVHSSHTKLKTNQQPLDFDSVNKWVGIVGLKVFCCFPIIIFLRSHLWWSSFIRILFIFVFVFCENTIYQCIARAMLCCFVEMKCRCKSNVKNCTRQKYHWPIVSVPR